MQNCSYIICIVVCFGMLGVWLENRLNVMQCLQPLTFFYYCCNVFKRFCWLCCRWCYTGGGAETSWVGDAETPRTHWTMASSAQSQAGRRDCIGWWDDSSITQVDTGGWGRWGGWQRCHCSTERRARGRRPSRCLHAGLSYSPIFMLSSSTKWTPASVPFSCPLACRDVKVSKSVFSSSKILVSAS